jgi:hypothetical protein
MAEVRKIHFLGEIPPDESYVLVMSGISTHDTIHPRGATFAVNDGYLNRNREADLAAAMSKAAQFAEDHQLPAVYVLE